jgi:hypothetical protein
MLSATGAKIGFDRSQVLYWFMTLVLPGSANPMSSAFRSWMGLKTA